MKLNKIKLALGLAGALTLSTGVYAAADQEKALADANNWAHPRGQHDNSPHRRRRVPRTIPGSFR